MPEPLFKIIENTRLKKPLIHCITNYVTANDTANLLLAAGARPVMADDIMEVEQIVANSCGLVLNIGTLNSRTVESMTAAAKVALKLGLTVVLDPVGAGASTFRTSTAKALLDLAKPSAVRANMSEIKAALGAGGGASGVDAAAADSVDDSNLDAAVSFLQNAAEKSGAVLAATGAIDLVCDHHKCYIIKNGVPQMSYVTGTGCMLSALLCAYVSANPENVLDAAAAAVIAMGLCGEAALKRMGPQDGNIALRNYIIDAVYNLDSDKFMKGAKYEIRQA